MTQPLPIALMLKSYAGDFAFAKRLVESFKRQNPEGLTLFCVVPASDLSLFAPLAAEHVVVMDEGPFEKYFVSEELNGTRAGYINQEIVKLSTFTQQTSSRPTVFPTRYWWKTTS
jgi:hypothetical protein